MRFNPKARLDTGRVRDAGAAAAVAAGLRRRRAARIPIPGGDRRRRRRSVGIIVVVVIFFVAQPRRRAVGGAQHAASTAAASPTPAATPTARPAPTPTTAPTAPGWPSRTRSPTSGSGELGRRKFHPEDRCITFSGVDQHRLRRRGSADVGPFYCPTDQLIYLDTAFFDQVLEGQLGGPDGGFVEAYVLAHEYGHHIQNLLGTMGQVRTQQGPQSDAVRLELQADCYAGMWAKDATETEDADGNVLFASLTDDDIDLALEAAASVGDDRIQQKTQGQVDPRSLDPRLGRRSGMRWFQTGYETGLARRLRHLRRRRALTGV